MKQSNYSASFNNAKIPKITIVCKKFSELRIIITLAGAQTWVSFFALKNLQSIRDFGGYSRAKVKYM